MTHTSTYTHTRTHTLTNTHSQHGNHTHNVYTNHGYAKQMQMTHFPILKCTNRNEKLCAEETIDWKSFLSFWSPVCLCYIVCSAVESFKSSRLFGFNYTKHVFSQTYWTNVTTFFYNEVKPELVFVSGHPPWESICSAKTQATHTSHTPSLTYELNGLQEPAADVFFVVVLYRNALVLVRPLEVVGTVGGHVQQGGDSHVVQDLLLWGVEGAAKVEERENLYWAALDEKRQMGGWMLISYFGLWIISEPADCSVLKA